jgi:GMP synthase (glutamine-hydrolysing)
MAPLRLLVVEGNTAEARARNLAVSGQTPSDAYAGVLKGLADDAVVDICFPADPGANIPDSEGIAGYDGVAITGSSLNLWRAEPESMRQVELARAVFAARVPFFGSCWGLQVAATAAGGGVRLNPRGRELGIGRKITLTDLGREHAMHKGRPWAFDAPTVHMDEVAVLPGEIAVTATNAVTEVQAAEIRWQGGVFWGVQYHPEYTLGDIAATLTRYNGRLIEEGFYDAPAELEAHIAGLESLHRDPAQPGLAWRLGIDSNILDPTQRLSEIANWISAQVRPVRSARSRG